MGTSRKHHADVKSNTFVQQISLQKQKKRIIFYSIKYSTRLSQLHVRLDTEHLHVFTMTPALKTLSALDCIGRKTIVNQLEKEYFAIGQCGFLHGRKTLGERASTFLVEKFRMLVLHTLSISTRTTWSIFTSTRLTSASIDHQESRGK